MLLRAGRAGPLIGTAVWPLGQSAGYMPGQSCELGSNVGTEAAGEGLAYSVAISTLSKARW